MKQMALAFVDADRIVNTKMVKKGQSVNSSFIVDALDSFLKIFCMIGSQLVEQGCIFHWDNTPVHTAAVVGSDWLTMRSRCSNLPRICQIWLRWTNFSSQE